MPIDYRNYPDNWKTEIVPRIIARADDRCECGGECGLHRGRRCCEINGHYAHYAKGLIVLTIAHMDHDLGHNTDDNLKALCQRCHNRYDHPHRMKNAKKTREAKKWKNQEALRI